MLVWIMSYVVAATLAFIFPDWALQSDETRDAKVHAEPPSVSDTNRENRPCPPEARAEARAAASAVPPR